MHIGGFIANVLNWSKENKKGNILQLICYLKENVFEDRMTLLRFHRVHPIIPFHGNFFTTVIVVAIGADSEQTAKADK